MWPLKRVLKLLELCCHWKINRLDIKGLVFVAKRNLSLYLKCRTKVRSDLKFTDCDVHHK